MSRPRPGVLSPSFEILGPIQARLADGSVAPLPRGRVLSLLALLLVERGAAVHADRIVDELWPAAGPRHARNAVQVLASRLRGVIGEQAVVSEGGGYALRVPDGAVDADRFEDALAAGRLEAAVDPASAAVTLQHALALWRGRALADVRDEGFAHPEVARLEELRLACLAERIDAELACGGHALLTAELERLVRQHPLCERFRAQLMVALYRVGRQADALAEYRSARLALAEELGLDPTPELRALEAAILRHELPAPPPGPRGPVYGRGSRSRGTLFTVLLACPSASATRAA